MNFHRVALMMKIEWWWWWRQWHFCNVCIVFWYT